MLLYPSQDQLLEKVNSTYSLVVLASKRSHQLRAGEKEMLDKYKSVTPVGKALEEIAAGDVILAPETAPSQD